MSSQKSTENAPAALAPKRKRGELRVAAILDAAAAIFAEKGFEGATMTEIAARADTAIGSLYRFFPTKEVLADALLARFSERIGAALDRIEAAAVGRTPRDLADALVAMMLDLQDHRTAVVVLVDARAQAAGEGEAAGNGARTAIRDMLRRRIAAALAAMAGRPVTPVTEARAAILLHLLKAIPALAQEAAERRPAMLTEIRRAARLYVAAADDPDGDGEGN